MRTAGPIRHKTRRPQDALVLCALARADQATNQAALALLPVLVTGFGRVDTARRLGVGRALGGVAAGEVLAGCARRVDAGFADAQHAAASGCATRARRRRAKRVESVVGEGRWATGEELRRLEYRGQGGMSGLADTARGVSLTCSRCCRRRSTASNDLSFSCTSGGTSGSFDFSVTVCSSRRRFSFSAEPSSAKRRFFSVKSVISDCSDELRVFTTSSSSRSGAVLLVPSLRSADTSFLSSCVRLISFHSDVTSAFRALFSERSSDSCRS
ncbi:hypothetical protein IWX47DRAFT_864656 [Phyllosticta citricarpa]